MAKVKKSLSDGVTLERNGVSIPAVMEISLTGRTAENIEVTTLDSIAREYESTLPNPGTLNGRLTYDPVNPLHIQMLNDFNNQTDATWAIRASGKKVDGNFTDDAEVIAEDLSCTIASGVLTVVSGQKERIKPGMWLTGSEDVKVTSMATASTFNVEKADGTEPTDVNVAADYDLEYPATKFSWEGNVNEFSFEFGDISAVQIVSFVIQLTGGETVAYGTPDLT